MWRSARVGSSVGYRYGIELNRQRRHMKSESQVIFFCIFCYKSCNSLFVSVKFLLLTFDNVLVNSDKESNGMVGCAHAKEILVLILFTV